MSMDESDRHLRAALRELAGDEADHGASLRVEADLRAHVRGLAHPEVRLKPDPTSPAVRVKADLTWRTWVAAAAAAAIFVLVWRFVPSQPPAPIASVASVAAGRDPQTGPADALAEFLPLPYAHVPTSGGQIVRMSVPRESLASFGFDPGHPGGPDAVLADVFVGSDGIARAVHFVGPDIREESQP